MVLPNDRAAHDCPLLVERRNVRSRPMAYHVAPAAAHRTSWSTFTEGMSGTKVSPITVARMITARGLGSCPFADEIVFDIKPTSSAPCVYSAGSARRTSHCLPDPGRIRPGTVTP